jgi:hypothetical protein
MGDLNLSAPRQRKADGPAHPCASVLAASGLDDD